MESPDVSPESKAELKRRETLYDPVELNGKLNDAVEKLLKLNREKGCPGKTPCRGEGQAAVA
jgi:hypothetical protein